MMQSSAKMNSPATLQLDCAKPTHIVIWTEDSPLASLVNRINDLESRLNTLLASLPSAAQVPVAAVPSAAPAAVAPAPATRGLYFPPSLSPHLSGLNVQPAEVDVELPVEAEQPEVEEPDAEELDEEQVEVEEEVVEEEEDEIMQNLVDFEWKDKAGVVQTYWRDSDNQVYEKDEDGDLNDTPIGIWNEAKQKLQRYAKAS